MAKIQIMNNQLYKVLIPILFVVGAGGAFFFIYVNAQKISVFDYSKGTTTTATTTEEIFVPTHVSTPTEVRAIYMTSWVAGTKSFRDELVSLIEETEINSVVIYIKDYSGKIAFYINDPDVEKYEAFEVRIPDIKEFIQELHSKGIYVIGRVTVFQDPYLAKTHPELAVLKASDKTIWKDYKGLSFTDPGNKQVWDYHVAIAKGSHNIGFDEINFDYIRFPSDGNMKDIYYPKSEEILSSDPKSGKARVMESFFAHLSSNLRTINGPVISADLFGMTTTNYDDLNIGQVLERTLPHFDYVSPMVYPSHYPKNFIGLNNPNSNPYLVVNYSMKEAVRRANATTTSVFGMTHKLVSTSTAGNIYGKETFSADSLRPWLQDFDYGGNYGANEVREQINATYDAGINSWMLWAPSNRYTKEALKPFYVEPADTATTNP